MQTYEYISKASENYRQVKEIKKNTISINKNSRNRYMSLKKRTKMKDNHITRTQERDLWKTQEKDT